MLYEDGAGSLHIHEEGHDRVYFLDGPLQDVKFAEDAESIAIGHGYDNWTAESYAVDDMPNWQDATGGEISGQLVAVYDQGEVEIVADPGRSGLEYLDIS